MLNTKATDDPKHIGFEQPHTNPYVFKRFVDGNIDTVIIIHVGDILAARKTAEVMVRFIVELGQKFALKNLGEANLYIGCPISRDRSERKVRLDQHIYVQTIADRFEVTKISMIPAAAGMVPLSKKDGPQSPKEENKIWRVPYRGAIGHALM